jgi:hypothetical protein
LARGFIKHHDFILFSLPTTVAILIFGWPSNSLAGFMPMGDGFCRPRKQSDFSLIQKIKILQIVHFAMWVC